MDAFASFVVRLLSDMREMPVIFVKEVVTNDPLSAISVLFGTIFIATASAVFGYVVLGALGIPLPNVGRGARD